MSWRTQPHTITDDMANLSLTLSDDGEYVDMNLAADADDEEATQLTIGQVDALIEGLQQVRVVAAQRRAVAA